MIPEFTGLYSLALRIYTILKSFSCDQAQTQFKSTATQEAGAPPIYTLMQRTTCQIATEYNTQYNKNYQLKSVNVPKHEKYPPFQASVYQVTLLPP